MPFPGHLTGHGLKGTNLVPESQTDRPDLPLPTAPDNEET
jgi:hypothetical protein